MGRLIDADILIAELKESALHHCNNPREDSLLQRDRVIVRAQPTVEAIPIPKGATNGDIIRKLFPKDYATLFDRSVSSFWNSPYKEK
jgi:hypothetical protein